MRKPKTTATRLVLADDHALVLAGLSLLFGRMPGIEVVGQATGGTQLLHVVDELKPDLVVTDLSMPEGDGLRAIEMLRIRHPKLKIIAISMYHTSDFVKRALRVGANGYVLKGCSTFEMEFAVSSVMAGNGYFSAQVSHELAATSEPRPDEVLTARQIEILILIAKGLRSKEIGFQLSLSPKTVDVHRAAIMSRLGLSEIASITLYAVRNGLIDPQESARASQN